MKLLVLLLISWSAFAQTECGDAEVRLLHKFFVTPFDKHLERRFLKISDTLPVLEAVNAIKTATPEAKITVVSVTSCASSYPLPALNKTSLPIAGENIKLAEQRRLLIEGTFPKAGERSYELKTHHLECSLPYDKKDTNLLGKVVVPGEPTTQALYDEGINSVLTDEFVSLLQKYGIAKNKEEAKALDANPWRVKYRYFEGYSLEVLGIVPCKTNSKSDVKTKSVRKK